MRSDQFIAVLGRLPVTLAARDEYGCARLIGEPISRLFDCHVEATISLSGARVGEYISPPILACSLLWMRPRPPGHCLTRLKHRHEQLRYVGLASVEEHEVWHPPR